MLGAVIGAVIATGLGAPHAWTPVPTLKRIAESAVLEARPGATVKAYIDGNTRLPACTRPPQATVRGSGATPSVVLACAGPQPWTFYVPVEVTQRQDVMVLTQSVYPGETIAAGMIQPQPRDTAELAAGYFTSTAAVVGQVVARALQAGTVLGRDDIHAPAVIHRGQIVMVEFRSSVLQVTTPGLALGDAAPGQTLKVENEGSHRIVSGTAAAAGVVVVGSAPES
ncbi:MAG: flagellar basal body P-ring formation chaperone FlgA [Rhodanobacteraceae bacterium]